MMRLLAVALLLGLAACAGVPKKSAPAPASATGKGMPERSTTDPKVSPYAPAQEDPNTRGDYVAGGLYKPGVSDSTPDYLPDVERIPEPDVVDLPRSKVGNRASYTVLGKTYRVLDDQRGFLEQGLASYYGKKFHGRRTSNMEVYDMYAFTAAHKSLPLPSFARVTNLDNGKSVVVRVNDRGPFHEGRVIDLSYAAAVKLDYVRNGTARVEVRALMPGDEGGPVYAATEPAAPPATSAMDTLISTIPASDATAGVAIDTPLPPGVRIATGKPAPVSAAGGAATSTGAPSAGHDRLDLHRNGQPMTADEFDAWMASRQVRVATGKPRQLAPHAASHPVPAAAAATEQTDGAAVTLQVAAFTARDNADRALARVRAAGIEAVQLLAGDANGQRVWRLRVGPLTAAAAPELAARIVGLGFGQPQHVRD